ncbi:type VII secretion protein EccE [Mycolicibacterium thermoresistibile]
MRARIALASLFIVAAALAYPWESTFDWWVLGIAAAVVLLLFIGWRGMFLTTMVRRRVAMWRRRKRREPADAGPATETVVLRVDPAGDDDRLPLHVIASYRDRYGIRADAVRITSRDRNGNRGGDRTSWVSITIRAVDNLDALRARSPHLPLQQTAVVAARRLADHLREIGWHATIVDATDVPAVDGKETWRGMCDESGYLAAYRVAVDDRLPDTFGELWSEAAPEVWTAVEITGSASRPAITAGCALRYAEKPKNTGPLPALTPQRGLHRPALEALAPTSGSRLIGDPVLLRDGLLDALPWPVGAEAGGERGTARHRRVAESVS